MFSQRRIHLFFLVGAAAIALFFAARFGWSLKDYLALRGQIPVRVSQWELEEIGERWAVRAVYSMNLKGKIWLGSSLLEEYRFLNEETAFRVLKDLAKREWTAWYNPKNPTHSSLEKNFPTNLMIRTLISFSVLLYFFIFQRWVNKKFLNC